MVRVITYGTFDLLHIGHVRLLERAKELGDELIVAISTDEFNKSKGKDAFYSYKHRREIVKALACVDLVIEEKSWEQKEDDIKNLNIDIFVMGSDWEGKFDYLNDLCRVVYLDRTDDISTTKIKYDLKDF